MIKNYKDESRNKDKKADDRPFDRRQKSNSRPYNRSGKSDTKLADKKKIEGPTFEGKIIANARGFAFCQLVKEDMDVFIAPPNMNGALNKDKVLITIKKNGDGTKTDGTVVEIIERGTHQIVGTFKAFKQIGFVISDDKKFTRDVFISAKNINKAKDGEKVVCRIIGYGEDGNNPQGEITEIIGDIKAKGNDILAIIRTYELYEEFPIEVMESAKNIPQKVSEKDIEGRVDLRDELTFTIDGEDAKDFDDAVSIKKREDGGYYLGVHIADVGHYVQMGSIIDKEAYNRATSVYFPDRVLPMIPVELSNGICSLNPKVDRLVMSVLMELDADGVVRDYKICEAVINSKERMTYDDVYACLCGDEEKKKRYSNLVESFELMHELDTKLGKILSKRGALDLDLPECYIKVDENGRTCDIVPRILNYAHRLIERFMILTNEVVASHFHKHRVPFMYRVHDVPTMEKMDNFFKFCGALGYNVCADPENVTPKDLQKILEDVKEVSYGRTVSVVLLRSLQKAKYSTKCTGHFGLASREYCHFTSPIRRYPDLAIHRIIKLFLHNELSAEKIVELNDFTFEASEQSSEREKLAEKAEREVDAFKKAEYMEQFIGNEFDAEISGVTQNGVFVVLQNTCEGFVSIINLPDDIYKFDERIYSLIGNSNRFMLGEKIRVKLIKANLEERKLDFAYVYDIEPNKLVGEKNN